MVKSQTKSYHIHAILIKFHQSEICTNACPKEFLCNTLARLKSIANNYYLKPQAWKDTKWVKKYLILVLWEKGNSMQFLFKDKKK